MDERWERVPAFKLASELGLVSRRISPNQSQRVVNIIAAGGELYVVLDIIDDLFTKKERSALKLLLAHIQRLYYANY